MQSSVTKYFRKQLNQGLYDEARRKQFRPLIIQMLDEKRLEGKILELGCGTTFTLPFEGVEPYGVDITPEMIKAFKKNYPQAHCIVADARYLPCIDGCFSAVVSNALLHHVVDRTPKGCIDNINRIIAETSRILSHKGILIIRELVVSHTIFTLVAYYITCLLNYLKAEIGILGIKMGVITFFLSYRTLETHIKLNGFEICRVSLRDWEQRYIPFPLGKQVILISENH